MPHSSSIDPIVARNLKTALSKNGRSAYSLATALGYAPNWFYNIINGKSGITLPVLRAVANELGMSLGELVDPPKEGLTGVVAESQARYGDQQPASEAQVVPLMRYAKPVFIPYARAAAGPDEPVFDETEETEVRYAIHKSVLPSWAREKHLLCIEATGDSMEPTLSEGDLIVLDRSKIEPVSGQLFVVRKPGGLVVKRLKRTGRTWRLVSDNPAYPPWSVGREDRVLGRVAWTGPQPAAG